MNKATIIEDAITYIKDLQKNVKDLSDQLLETEAFFDEEVKTWGHELDAAKQMTQNGVEVYLHNSYFAIIFPYFSWEKSGIYKNLIIIFLKRTIYSYNFISVSLLIGRCSGDKYRWEKELGKDNV